MGPVTVVVRMKLEEISIENEETLDRTFCLPVAHLRTNNEFLQGFLNWIWNFIEISKQFKTHKRKLLKIVNPIAQNREHNLMILIQA